MALPDLASQLEAQLGEAVSLNTSVSDLTTYRLGGPVAVVVRVFSENDLVTVGQSISSAQDEIPLIVIGRGSNLLVADSGFMGVGIILDGEFTEVKIEPGLRVTAGGAVPLPVVARQSAAAGLTGLEFLVGIPGSIGGAVRMNAGGHGREIREVLDRARIVDIQSGKTRICRADDLDFSYRSSNVKRHEVVVQAELRVSLDDPDACRKRIDDIVRWRRENQPGGANAGSTFKNPPGDSAGRLIDSAGLKGLRVGGVVVSEKHANFLQAEEGATARDVYELMKLVQRKVKESCGIDLESELHTVGFDENL